ncbi:MAG: MBL fold metallo-hydrolase [Alphaproteobacteria bacterium]|nr:MBL fold metallo-hydrolase [Alphaproteobacteria bacterium]
MNIQAFFDKNTSTITYVVSDETTHKCAIIDPVLDYDPLLGKITTNSADILIEYIKSNALYVEWILETHIHADHLTAAHYLKVKLGGKIAIGANITEILKFWIPIFNTSQDTPLDGSQFDYLFKDNEHFSIGSLDVKIMYTPGHTPACISYLINDAIFVGDTIFMPHMGTGRTDFPGGSAEILYDSIQKILQLPPETRIFTCHDCPAEGTSALYESTVKEEKKSNILINDAITKEEYIEKRRKRDQSITVPRLLLPAIQVNMRAGYLGKAESNEMQYIKIPINKIGV